MQSALRSRPSLVFFAICLAAALSVPLSGQEARRTMLPRPVPAFQDWSTRHLVYTNFGEMRSIQSAAHDPRAMFSWRRRVRLWPPHGLESGHPVAAPTSLQRDWSINLGVAGTAPAMYPAKFTFDVGAAPSCTADFVVFPVNAPGGPGQPNIAAFDHLYSGTAGGNGICNRTPSGSDLGTSAEVAWSYNVQGILGGGAVTSSPVLSFDLVGTTPSGAKVAFVESTSGGQILTAVVRPGHAGNNYAVGDTGTITGGTGALATYQVTAVSGGGVTAFTITYSGTGQTTRNNAGTTRTSGLGNGALQLNITAVSSSSAAHFHVLAWKAGDGRSASNLQNVLAPVTISTFALTAPAPGSGTATDLALGLSTAGTDTLSSPFVDYTNDVAYVGNDIGVLYRIKDVFCTGNNPDCAGPIQPAPSLDATWGTGGAVTIGGTCTGGAGQLTAPVLDFVTLNVYVGCADGKLYQISPTGTVTSLTVGDSRAARIHGGIVDPPIVDGVNGFVYVASGSANNGANGVLVQAKVGLASSVAVPIGSGNQCDLHAPALNNAYYTSPTSPGALIYIPGVIGTVGPCTATGATGGTLRYYAVTFGAGGVMTPGAPAASRSASVGTPGNEFAPMTEFFNPNLGGGRDLIFFSAITTGDDMAALNVTNGFPGSAFVAGPVTEGFGTSGMVVDNFSTSTQAASVYFNALAENAACTGNTGVNTTPGTGGCAVKLTQSGLQ
jgi:hypothetical protein